MNRTVHIPGAYHSYEVNALRENICLVFAFSEVACDFQQLSREIKLVPDRTDDSDSNCHSIARNSVINTLLQARVH